MSKRFANTGRLMRFALRTDRIKLPVWVTSLVLFTILFGQMIPGLYTTGIDRKIMAETMKNPAITVMLGPGYGLDNYTDGAMMAHFMLLFSAIAFGIMSILLTADHTREDEEEGRLEMIRSLPTGALSPLTATVLTGVITNVIMALLIGFGLASLGFETMDLNGSLLYGASLGAIGIYFVVLTGLFAQLTPNARATTGYSFAFLIITYILRGIGDVSSEALSLITPFGFILRTQVYVNNYWWPVWVTLIISTLVFVFSLYLNSIRDLGAGFISTKPGKTYASGLLSFPTGLALRLQRSSIIAWTVGLFVLGSSYGSILGDLEGFIESSDLIKQMIPDTGDGLNMTERFVSLLMTILSIMGSVPVLLFVLKLRSEEKKNRTEHILTRAVSRNSLLGGYTVIALIAAPVIQLASLSGLWSSAVMVMEDPVSFQTLLTAGMVALPAMWCMVALAVLLIGVAPNRTGLTWLYLGYTFFVVYMGDMLKLPDWTNKLTPFGYIPQIPTEEINVFTLIILTMIAILLMVMGFMAYNKRRERYITMAHKLGVSGSTIFSDSKLFSELFWEGIEHIEIGEFSDEDAVNTFLKIYKEKQVGFGIHSPVIRGESKYDLIEKVRYDPSYAWEQLESEAKRMSLEGAKYILVHFPFFKAEVSGNTDEMIEEGLKKICRIQKKYSIPIICEPKLGFQRSVAGLNYFDQFPLSIWEKYNVGICIDIGDYLIAVEDDIFRYIGKWREFIKVVHLHNIVYEPDTYIWTPVHPSDEQRGNHKVQKIIEFLAQSKDVTFVFEHTPETKPTKSFVMEGCRWVESLIR